MSFIGRVAPWPKVNGSSLTLPRITDALGGCARTATDVVVISTHEVVGSPLMERLVHTPLAEGEARVCHWYSLSSTPVSYRLHCLIFRR